MAPPLPPTVRPLRAALLLAAYWMACLILGAATAVLVVRAAAHLPEAWTDWMLRRGPEKVMSRTTLIWAFALLFPVLRRIGWGGWSDAGFADPAGRAGWRPRARQAAGGMLLALLSMGPAALWALARGSRVLSPSSEADPWPLVVASAAATAAAVAFLEETLVRGIFYRTLARIWRALPAALVTSLFFAAAHFMRASPEPFDEGSLPVATARLVASVFANVPLADAVVARSVNLTLLGLVLCAFVARTGAIWVSIGAHAGWVWIIGLNAAWTVHGTARPVSLWWGRRADLTDSLATGACLAVLLAAAAWWPRPAVGLARRRRAVAVLAAVALAGLAAGAALTVRNRLVCKRWGEVVADRIYRSAQPPSAAVGRLLVDRRIDRIVDLTDRETRNADRVAEIDAARRLRVRRVEAPLSGDGRGDPAAYVRALSEMEGAVRKNRRLLVHCSSGTQRVGGVVAAYRLLFEGWPAERALAEMRAYGWDARTDGVLVEFLDAHLPQIAASLAERGLLAPPAAIPRLSPEAAAGAGRGGDAP